MVDPVPQSCPKTPQKPNPPRKPSVRCGFWVLRSFLGGGRVPVVAVMHERAVVRRIGEDLGSGEFLVHPSTPDPPGNPNTPR